jgi:hypothetical protein
MTPETLARVSLWMTLPLFAIGTLLHFLYEWTGEKRFIAHVAAVNESYWEHIKIAFWPLFIYYAVMFFAGGHQLPGFVPAATIALYAVPVAMIALVFGYKRLTGRNILWLDILVFLITIVASLAVFVLLCSELAASGLTIGLATAFLAVLLFAFTTYTLWPPAEPDFFKDPLNELYGLAAHDHDKPTAGLRNPDRPASCPSDSRAEQRADGVGQDHGQPSPDGPGYGAGVPGRQGPLTRMYSPTSRP